MNSIEPHPSSLTFTPLSSVQPSANGIVGGSIVDSFAQQQLQQKPWNQSPPSASSVPPPSARNVMFGGGANPHHNPSKLSLPICTGCNQPILDKYVLHIAPDSTWHSECLRCAECSQPLDESCTCYVRNGRAYCKNDYNKLFGVRCARCQKTFSRHDSIMRVRSPTNGNNVMFHTDCFTCYACGCPLLPGSRFALLNEPSPTSEVASFLLCEHDFDDRPFNQQQRVVRPTSMLLAGDSPMIENHHPFGQPALPQVAPMLPPGMMPSEAGIVMLDTPNGQPRTLIEPHRVKQSSGADSKGDKTSSSASSCSSSNNANSNHNNSQSGGGRSQHQMGGRSRESKTTRVRTVLNEKQLNTLRACYAANPRPDALMKEQLVEMTGLSPRVIRVWFQNKRCKDKKKSMLMKLQAQHMSNSDKVAALQSAIPLIAQDGVPHSGESPVHGSDVPIHSFSQSAWKSLHDFAMNADIEPSASFQQFVNGVGDSAKLTNQRRAMPSNGRNSHNQTSDGISEGDDDDDDLDGEDDEVLGDDDDEMMAINGASAQTSSPPGLMPPTLCNGL